MILSLLPLPGYRLLLGTGRGWERRTEGLHLDGFNGWIFCGSEHLIPEATRSVALQTDWLGDLRMWTPEKLRLTLYFLRNGRKATFSIFSWGLLSWQKSKWTLRGRRIKFTLWFQPRSKPYPILTSKPLFCLRISAVCHGRGLVWGRSGGRGKVKFKITDGLIPYNL